MGSRLLLGAILGIVGTLPAGAQDTKPQPASFVISADPSVAPQINEVLRSIAEPIELPLDPPASAENTLKRMCGDGAPKEFQVVRPASGAKGAEAVRFLPCIRRRSDLKFVARSGDNREFIAVRLGLRPSGSSRVTVSRNGRPLTSKERILPGDDVLVRGIPDWTRFTSRSPSIRTRDDVVVAIAKALGCPKVDEGTCLHSRGIVVITDRRGEAPTPTRQLPAIGAPSASSALSPVLSTRFAMVISAVQSQLIDRAAKIGDILGEGSAGATAESAGGAAAEPRGTDTVPANVPIPANVTYPANLSAADLASAKVANGQWPEDKALVAEIMAKTNNVGRLTDTVIGVADNGLGTPSGSPMPRDLFVNDAGESNGNDIPDDVIGAGISRINAGGSLVGDVSVCPDPRPDYSSWQGAQLERGSHGSVVTALASGLWLRKRNAGFNALLPRVQFFRIAANVCADAPGADEKAAIDAINYIINTKTRILNLSSLVDGDSGGQFTLRLKDLFTYGPPLLIVLPTGNNTGNLDDSQPCPPCLGSINNGPTSKRLVVVGAATQDLRVASYSGRGFRTVRIFAPGEASGAVDLAGRDASAFEPATSYAAPRVSLAAALIRMQLGVDDPGKLMTRLMLSTWPLFGSDNGNVGRAGGAMDVGVLDLVKAAAVRYDAVEVIERQPNGALDRRTYVGDITDGLPGLCPEFTFSGATYSAVEMGPAALDGSRQMTLISRRVDPLHMEPSTMSKPCMSTGAIKVRALRDKEVTLPTSAITKIIFRTR